MEMAKEMIVSMLVCGIVGLALHLYNNLVLKPRRLRSKLEKQGIRGPSPSFLVGNIPDIKRMDIAAQQFCSSNKSMHDGIPAISHDLRPLVFPYFQQWQKEYGPIFTYSVGNLQKLCIADPEMVKEMNTYTGLDLGKPMFLSKERGTLLGDGILSANGPAWAYQRKVITPPFSMDKVKGMVDLMLDSTTSVLKSWEDRVDSAGGTADIRIEEDLTCVSADIISRVSFGSNYAQGQEIFSKLKNVRMLLSKGTYGIPGLRYVPTKRNREIWKLDKEISSSILKVVEEREGGAVQNDFLQSILDAAKDRDFLQSKKAFGMDWRQFIVGNCKNMYLAGHETTAITVSWCLMLLATHPEWQARARAEVLEICQGNLPDADMLRSMKLLTMVMQETLRLYPPTHVVVREAYEDIKFKNIHIPKGLLVWTPIVLLHQNRDLWGPDAHEFKPERFEHGIAEACKIPQAYMPFGLGPRICAGQHFATMESKVILSLVLSKFQFSLSPTYRHFPVQQLVVTPRYGVHLKMSRV